MHRTDIDLLRVYADTSDEGCFEELVKRHVGLVYSMALRHLGGDVHLAQDVSQMVFTHLAHNAKSLLGQRALAGWLFRDAFFTASKMVRSERRRVEREKQATMLTSHSAAQQHANELLPALDEIISKLRPKERDALVLRFFNGMEFHAAAALLGISKGAFEKRVERAVRKLRAALASRGIALGSGAITTALLAGGLVASTPPSLAAMIAGSSLTSAAAVKSNTFLTLIHGLTMTKLKIAGSFGLVAAVTTAILIQQKALTNLREQNRQLLRESQRGLAENSPVTRPPGAIAPDEGERLRAGETELLRLRGEVALRRRQVEELKAQLALAAAPTGQGTHDAQQAQQAGRYVAAETWSNVGLGEPQSAAITFFWALREANQAAYGAALGKAMPAPAEAWVNAFKSVKGSFLSDPELQPDGDVKVNVAHETKSGEIVNTLLTYHQEDGKWLIGKIAGFPIVLLEANSGAAGYAMPMGGPSSR